MAERSARRAPQAGGHPRRRRRGSPPTLVVLGYGINVGATAYPPELRDRATSLESELGRPVDRALLFAETLAALARRYDDLLDGRFDAILDAWRAPRAGQPRRARVVDDAAGARSRRHRRHRRPTARCSCASAIASSASSPAKSTGHREIADCGLVDCGPREVDMLLAIDVGNTNIVLGVFDGDDARPELAAADAARAHGRRARPARRRPVRAQRHRPVADRRRRSSARSCRR